MRQSGFERKLTEIIKPEVESLGFGYWGLSAPSSGSRRVIRIYIDGPEGVSIDDCATVSRQVGLVLEVEDIVPGAFTLEVSSPGLERKFFTLDQMGEYKGKTVEVKLFAPVNSCKHFKGTLSAVEADSITLDMEKESIRMEWDAVREAKLVHEF